MTQSGTAALTPVFPAPLWRRLAAAFYDGLLLAAIWMIVAMADALLRGFTGVPYSAPLLRAALFLAGLIFCGWFWTHGGQTLGMRAWRLQLRRSDGRAVGWPTVLSRYAFAWLAWLPCGAGVLLSVLDAQGRAWHDRFSGTELILLPRSSGVTSTPDPSSSPPGGP